MKKLIGVVVLSFALLLSAGCSFEINLGGNPVSSGNASDNSHESSSDRQDSADANQADGTSAEQAQKTDTPEDGEASSGSSQGGSENEAEVELLNAPTVNYCSINGRALTEGYFVYTNDSTYGEMFTFVVVPSDYSYAMMIAALIPPSLCKEGLVLRDSELTSGADLYYVYVDGYTLDTYEILSSQSPQSFSDMEFCLYSYTASGSAVYSIKTELTDQNGNTMSVELGGGGAYTDPSQFQQIQSGSTTDTNGSCWACHGSKICSICLGKRKYYVSGYGVTAGSYVNCAGCNGTGICSYCA